MSIGKAMEIANKIYAGDRDNYDGADGAREVRDLCDTCNELITELETYIK